MNITLSLFLIKKKTSSDLIRLYLHESRRVYGDKLIDKDDSDAFVKLQYASFQGAKKNFEDFNFEDCFRLPNIYCHFSQGVGEPKYVPVESWSFLNSALVKVLDNYNELNSAMNLVLFEDAIMHVCRINRILELPRGNALLIGVGGSGKQSLSRLAGFISSLEVFQIQFRKGKKWRMENFVQSNHFERLIIRFFSNEILN